MLYIHYRLTVTHLFCERLRKDTVAPISSNRRTQDEDEGTDGQGTTTTGRRLRDGRRGTTTEDVDGLNGRTDRGHLHDPLTPYTS